MKYEAKVKYVKLDEISGKEKSVSESYIIENAETFADAEEQTFKFMEQITSSTVVAAIKISDIEEIIYGNGSFFYRAKAESSSLDEISGKEKKIPAILLIQKDDFDGALEECNDWMDMNIFDSELISITKTKIIDIIEKNEK